MLPTHRSGSEPGRRCVTRFTVHRRPASRRATAWRTYADAIGKRRLARAAQMTRETTMRTPLAQRLGLAGLALALLLSVGLYARASATRMASSHQPATPQEYLATVLDWVEANSLNIDRVDWPAVRQEAEARAQDAGTPADTYPTIRW